MHFFNKLISSVCAIFKIDRLKTHAGVDYTKIIFSSANIHMIFFFNKFTTSIHGFQNDPLKTVRVVDYGRTDGATINAP